MIENMLRMQAENLSLGQMFCILEKMNNTGKYI